MDGHLKENHKRLNLYNEIDLNEQDHSSNDKKNSADTVRYNLSIVISETALLVG